MLLFEKDIGHFVTFETSIIWHFSKFLLTFPRKLQQLENSDLPVNPIITDLIFAPIKSGKRFVLIWFLMKKLLCRTFFISEKALRAQEKNRSAKYTWGTCKFFSQRPQSMLLILVLSPDLMTWLCHLSADQHRLPVVFDTCTFAQKGKFPIIHIFFLKC